MMNDPVVLGGHDYIEFGVVGSASCGPRGAIALTRGRHPKPYAHLDPNEDYVAASHGRDRYLVVVADGHNGVEAAAAAVGHVLAVLGEGLPGPELADEAMVGLLANAGLAAWHATREHPYPRRGSRTALGLALVRGSHARWAAVGDVAVIVSGREGARVLNTLEEIFLGGPAEPHHVAQISAVGEVRLREEEWLVLGSDGLLNFASLEDVVAVVSGGQEPEAVARALAERAGDRGAGDNVAVAVLAPL